MNKTQMRKTTRRPEKGKQCEAATHFCSGELIRTYSVNGSKKEGKMFNICGPCAVMIRRGGAKMEELS